MKSMFTSFFYRVFFAYLLIVPFCSGLCQGPPPPTRYQLIHNASDPVVDSVALFLSSVKTKLTDYFSYRTATPVTTAFSGPALVINVDFPHKYASDPIGYEAHRKESDEFYAVFLHGVYESGFVPNPDSVSTKFEVDFYKVPERPLSLDSTHFVFVNGVTDLAKVNLQDLGNGMIEKGAIYAPRQQCCGPYPLKSFSLKANIHTLLLTDSAGTEEIGAFFVDLTSLGNQRAILFTSGFKTPSLNKNGPTLGLFAVLSDSTVIEFPRVITTDIGNERGVENTRVFPIPAQNRLHIRAGSRFSENVTVKIANQSGAIVWNRQFPASIQNMIEVNTEGIAQGVYYVTLSDDKDSQTLKCIVER